MFLEAHMGPIAPKDPVRQRDFFYIMLEKQISASPTPEGRGVCFIYENDGRMISAAKIIGGIEDEEIFKCLATTEGFRKLVYGIGVSMQCSDTDGCDFAFQMYGKKDAYVTGTTIRQHLSADGVEYLIPLSEVDWSDDDDIPGQIRFEFEKPGLLATVNVRFYLNDGYHAPNLSDTDPVDLESDRYKKMLKDSVVSTGDPGRLKKVIEKAGKGEEITIAFIGGSITQGAGATPLNTMCYARKMFEAFTSRYDCADHARFVKAGVGGTPSELGMIRYRKDVEHYGVNHPDLVVIEFAVNDAGDETGGECYESLIRKVLSAPEKPAVLLIFSVFADDYNLEERCIPIGEHYALPMTSVKRCVTPQFYLKPDEGRVISKARFFYDCYHPTNMGHKIMTDCLMQLIEDTLAAAGKTENKALPEADTLPAPLMSGDFENVELFDRGTPASFDENKRKPLSDDYDHPCFNAKVDAGGFTDTDKALQFAEMDLDAAGTPQFPDNWSHVPGSKEPFVMDIVCRRLLIVTKDSSDTAYGRAEVYVDGNLSRSVNPLDIGWNHCNPLIILREDEPGLHHVEVRMAQGEEEKLFTILGFGVVE